MTQNFQEKINKTKNQLLESKYKNDRPFREKQKIHIANDRKRRRAMTTDHTDTKKIRKTLPIFSTPIILNVEKIK